MKKELSDKADNERLSYRRCDPLPKGLRLIGQSFYVDTRPRDPIKRIIYEIGNYLKDAFRP